MTVLDDAIEPAPQPEAGPVRLLVMAVALVGASLGGAALASVANPAPNGLAVSLAE